MTKKVVRRLYILQPSVQLATQTGCQDVGNLCTLLASLLLEWRLLRVPTDWGVTNSVA